MEVKKWDHQYSSPVLQSQTTTLPHNRMRYLIHSVVKTKPKERHTQGDYPNKRMENRCLIKIRIWWKWDSQLPFLALFQDIILKEQIPDRKLVYSSLGNLPRRTELQILTLWVSNERAGPHTGAHQSTSTTYNQALLSASLSRRKGQPRVSRPLKKFSRMKKEAK